MSKILRKFQKIFGGSLPATGNIAKFGSLAAGTPAYSLDPDVIQALAAFDNGWAGATTGNSSPAKQDRNALDYLVTRALAYIMQAGIPEWDTATVYYIGSWAQSAGVAYRSTQDSNSGHAVTDTNWWEVCVPASNNLRVAKAWVNFDGTGTVGADCAINASYNVSTVHKVAAGIYLINFAAPTTDAFYTISGSCGTPDGVSPIGGDNNVIVGGNVRTTSQCKIISWESAGGLGAEDSKMISVNIFGN